MTSLAKRGRLLAVLGVIALGSVLFTGAQSFAADPPGNNGTVKVDGVEFDVLPNNEPHVGCVFQIDFYGFDEGDLNAKVAFKVWPPTGDMETILTDKVFIGEDSNAGGGSVDGLDAQATYDLSPYLKSYMAHPQQGYHIKLVVNAEGSQGADKKHKAFWVAECAYGSPS
ncbi:MAG TPA: hypothetical protein VMT88_03720 [Actinomycetes bacterium]|nr:hypothetical protein [Actinomycetes bacterium]